MTGHILEALSTRDMALGPFADTHGEGDRWRHWRLARDGQDVVWIILDKAEARANVLSEAVLEELGDLGG